jgi:hypothetical protein
LTFGANSGQRADVADGLVLEGSAENAVMAMGTSCTFCSRFCRGDDDFFESLVLGQGRAGDASRTQCSR